MMMFTCQSLIVVKNATSSGSKVVKIDGKKDGDQMQITKKRLKQIIQEEVDRANRLSKGKENKINQIITIVESLNEAQLTQLHEMLKRNK